MENELTKFWNNFHNKDFVQAQNHFDALGDVEKQAALSELFQKSEYHRMPDMVSVLHRELHNEKTFGDFYQAWLPGQGGCNPIDIGGQTFQQFLPAPTRVINAVNIKNPKEILSIGLTWVSSEEQGRQMWEATTAHADSQPNQDRRDSIKKVADKISSELYEPKSDVNLGVPF